MHEDIKVLKNSTWRHRKYDPADSDPLNFTYKVTGVIFDAERDVCMVLYVPLYRSSHLAGSDGYARTIENFLGRFTLVQ